MNASTYLTLLSIVSPLIREKIKHYNAASCNSVPEIYSHFKIFGDREKLRGSLLQYHNLGAYISSAPAPDTCDFITLLCSFLNALREL